MENYFQHLPWQANITLTSEFLESLCVILAPLKECIGLQKSELKYYKNRKDKSNHIDTAIDHINMKKI